MEGLKILKPHIQKVPKQGDALDRVLKQTSETYAGVNLEVDIVSSEEEIDDGMAKWVVENLKFSVKQPVNRFPCLMKISSSMCCIVSYRGLLFIQLMCS